MTSAWVIAAVTALVFGRIRYSMIKAQAKYLKVNDTILV